MSLPWRQAAAPLLLMRIRTVGNARNRLDAA
jgi:hypothetical protein